MKSVTATPATVTATPNPPITVTSQRATYCAMCSALGKPYLLFCSPAPTVSLPHSNLSNTEKEEDWDGERQKENKHREREQKEKELKLKSKNNKGEEYFPPSSQYRPYSSVGKNEDTLAPTFTDSLVPAPEKMPGEDGEQNMEVDTKDTPDMDSETDYDSDDNLRAELI